MGKTYFASDFHLGTPNHAASLVREKRIVRWLNAISHDVETLMLVGDIFDFWYEYNTVVPKYHTRLLGKLAELSDRGVKIYFFKGNHDMWTFDYLRDEVGMEIIDEELEIEIDGHSFFIHHGDAIGPGDHTYKFIRKVFRSRWAIWLFHRMHPNFGIGLAHYLSRRSRAKNSIKDEKIIPLSEEFQYQYANTIEQEKQRNFYIFGHRHLPRDEAFGQNARFINLGDWVNHCTYAVFDGNAFELKTYTD